MLDRAQPRPWPWLTAHFLHTDVVHLGWNVFAFGCLGVLGEREGRVRFATAIAAGIVAVDIWFAWINVDLRFYCGLSGVLNTVLLVTLYALRGRIAARWLFVAAVLVALEARMGVAQRRRAARRIRAGRARSAHTSRDSAPHYRCWLSTRGATVAPTYQGRNVIDLSGQCVPSYTFQSHTDLCGLR